MLLLCPERPWGPCSVAARVFLRTNSDEQGVIRPKNSDQLVLARPLIHTVVFQIATLESLITGEKVSAAWDIRSERVPKQCLSKLAEVPGQVVSSNAAPPVEPPGFYAVLHSLQKVRRRIRVRLQCTASSPELEAARLEKLNKRLKGFGSEHSISLYKYRRTFHSIRRADQPRLEQALKRGGLWTAKRQATTRIETGIIRRLVAEKSSDHGSAMPLAAAAAGETCEPHEAPVRPGTYGDQQKKTRNRKKRERKNRVASSGGGAAGKGFSGSSASRRLPTPPRDPRRPEGSTHLRPRLR